MVAWVLLGSGESDKGQDCVAAFVQIALHCKYYSWTLSRRAQQEDVSWPQCLEGGIRILELMTDGHV